ALREAAAFAETIGCPVYQQSVPYGAHFLSEHACFMGALSRNQRQVRDVLFKFDLMIVLGADPVRMSVWSEVDAMPSGLAVAHIGLIDWDMGKNFAAELAVRADVRETLQALTPLLKRMGGSRRGDRARLAMDALASANWLARRNALARRIETRKGHTPIATQWLTS